MPPKFKFTRHQIIDSAINLIRKKGWNALTTRSLAVELGTSARPIYSFFKSTRELEIALVKRAVDLLHKSMVCKRTSDPWIDHGIGYVMFAQADKHLFRGINNTQNIPYFKKYGDIIWLQLTASLADYPLFQGLTDQQILLIQTTRWLFAHGLAFQVSNPPPDVWNDQTIVEMIEQGSRAIYDGLLKQFGSDN